MDISEEQLVEFLARFFWPLLRIGAFYLALPVFNGHAVPVRVRVILTVTTVWALMPILPQPPKLERFDLGMVLLAVRETLIGVAMGSVLQLAFAALMLAGQLVAYSMGLGFAALLDPQTDVQVPIVSQIYLLFATLLFLAMDGHLLLIELIAQSFTTLPLALARLGREEIWTVVTWSSSVFAGGVLLSLPIVVTLLFINVALGVATRSAPQLNLFAVGFPITLLVGLLLLLLTFSAVLESFTGFLPSVYELIRTLMKA